MADETRGAPAGAEDDVVDLTAGAGVAPAEDVVDLPEDGEEDVGLPKEAELQEDGTILLPLAQPVTLRFRQGGKEVRAESFESLRFHPLTGADMRVIQAQKGDSIMSTAIARSTRIHEGKMNAVYDRMDARDATACQRVVLHFLGGGR